MSTVQLIDRPPRRVTASELTALLIDLAEDFTRRGFHLDDRQRILHRRLRGQLRAMAVTPPAGVVW